MTVTLRLRTPLTQALWNAYRAAVAHPNRPAREAIAPMIEAPLHEWLAETENTLSVHISGAWNGLDHGPSSDNWSPITYDIAVTFENDADAVAFKLRWSDEFEIRVVP